MRLRWQYGYDPSSSAIPISLLGLVPNAFAIRRIDFNVGLRTPRSIPLM